MSNCFLVKLLKFNANSNCLLNNNLFLIRDSNCLTIIKFKNTILQKNHNSMMLVSNSGTSSSICYSLFKGLYLGFKKVLELRGIGYKAEFVSSVLKLKIGFSHIVEYCVPRLVNLKVKKLKIKVYGFNLQQVSQVAARIRLFKKPDAYKGKGLRYVNEKISLKEGKKRKK